MKVFLDTSSLIKSYHQEEGTDVLDKFFADNIITEIFISEIAKTEFFSAIYKKVRAKAISLQAAMIFCKPLSLMNSDTLSFWSTVLL